MLTGEYDCIEKCPCGSESTAPSTQDLWPHDFETEARELDTTPEDVSRSFDEGTYDSPVQGLGQEASVFLFRRLVAPGLVSTALITSSFFIKNDDAKEIVRGLGLVMGAMFIGSIIAA